MTKTLSRLAEQDTWNDVFSTKLIELLDKSDQLKREIRESMRRADTRITQAEAVSQAEAALMQTSATYGGAGWAAALLAHEPIVGLPTSVVVRLIGGQLLHNQGRRKLLEGYTETVTSSRRKLELQVQRQLLGDGV
ncbi:MAG TPA: hypothetical protein VK638_27875 [Edaphobacter sp.]|nr:hypothetical protein [Edaphobacter sp.]